MLLKKRVKSTPQRKFTQGCQTIFSPDGSQELFSGQWDSRALFKAVSGGDTSYWSRRRVLDLGANTSGLSVELARHGAAVVAAEPDPYALTRAKALPILEQVIETERLDLKFRDEGLFDAHELGTFDTVLCLGLIYHFRDQQFVLDYLSGVDTKDLIISNQTHPGDSLTLTNRKEKGVLPESFFANHNDALSGWHPTRALFVRMLEFAGFEEVVSLTERVTNFPKKPLEGLTNSAYFRARRVRTTDPIASRRVYYPR